MPAPLLFLGRLSTVLGRVPDPIGEMMARGRCGSKPSVIALCQSPEAQVHTPERESSRTGADIKIFGHCDKRNNNANQAGTTVNSKSRCHPRCLETCREDSETHPFNLGIETEKANVPVAILDIAIECRQPILTPGRDAVCIQAIASSTVCPVGSHCDTQVHGIHKH